MFLWGLPVISKSRRRSVKPRSRIIVTRERARRNVTITQNFIVTLALVIQCLVRNEQVPRFEARIDERMLQSSL